MTQPLTGIYSDETTRANTFGHAEALAYRQGQPFPSGVYGRIWNNDLLDAVVAEFPLATDPRWITYPQPEEFGKHCGTRDMWGPATTALFGHLASPEWLAKLEHLTGISGLIADTIGGGMHMTTPGGRLHTHTDFNIHPSLPGYIRKINLLIFLNEYWEEDKGGWLILGKEGQPGGTIHIPPTFNTTAIFTTSDQSFHGHPVPLAEGLIRRSVACYYWAPRNMKSGRALPTTMWG